MAPGSGSVNKCLHFKKETCIYAGDCPVPCYAFGSHHFSLSGPEGRSLCGLGRFPSVLPVPSAPPFLHKWGQADAPVVPGGPLQIVSWGSPPLGPLFSGPLPAGSSLYLRRTLPPDAYLSASAGTNFIVWTAGGGARKDCRKPCKRRQVLHGIPVRSALSPITELRW